MVTIDLVLLTAVKQFSQRLIPWGVKYTDKDFCEQFVI